MNTPYQGDKNNEINKFIFQSADEETHVIDLNHTKKLLEIYNDNSISHKSLYIPNTGELTTEGLIKDVARLGISTLTGTTPATAARIGGKHLLKLAGSKIASDIKDAPPRTVEEMKKPIPSFLASTDTPNSVNKMKIRPQGIMVCDTYNHPIFPIPLPRIDTAGFDLPDIKKRYEAFYTKLSVDFLPWHYVVEIIQGEYYFFSTRPIDMKFPVRTLEAEKLIEANKGFIELNDSAKDFFKTKPFDLQDSIHIAVLGDTSRDIYTRKIYEVISRLCAGPILRYFKLPSKVGQRVIDFNLGNKFHINQLDMYLRR